MKMEWLQCFLAVARTGSMNKAAEQLYIAQPTVTKMLQSLEKELDTALFQRQNTGVVLTEDGKLFLPHAKAVVREMDSYRSKRELLARREGMKEPEVLEVACSSLLLQLYHKEMFGILKNVMPNTRLQITETDYDDVLPLLQQKHQRIALISMPCEFERKLPDNIVSKSLLQSAVGVCINKTAGLTKNEVEKVIEDSAYQMVSLGFAYKYYGEEQSNRYQMSTTNLELAKETLMTQDNTYMLMPKEIAERFLDWRLMDWLPMEKGQQITVGMLYHKTLETGEYIAAWTLQQLEREFRSMLKKNR